MDGCVMLRTPGPVRVVGCRALWYHGTMKKLGHPSKQLFFSALVGFQDFIRFLFFSLVVFGVHFYGDCLIDRFSDFSSGFNKGRSNHVTCRAG